LSSSSSSTATTSTASMSTSTAAAPSFPRIAASGGRGRSQGRGQLSGRGPESSHGRRPPGSSAAADAPMTRQTNPQQARPELALDTIHQRGAARSRSPSAELQISQHRQKPRHGSAAGSPPAMPTGQVLLSARRQSNSPRPPSEGGTLQQ
jgi:hypothetical protein